MKNKKSYIIWSSISDLPRQTKIIKLQLTTVAIYFSKKLILKDYKANGMILHLETCNCAVRCKKNKACLNPVSRLFTHQDILETVERKKEKSFNWETKFIHN